MTTLFGSYSEFSRRFLNQRISQKHFIDFLHIQKQWAILKKKTPIERTTMKNFFVVLLFALVVFGSRAFSQSAADVPGITTIDRSQLMETDRFLASKDLQGRLSGSEGYNKAAEYMSEQFHKLGLKPLGDDGYYQKFDVEYVEIKAPMKLNMVENEKVVKEYTPGKDFVCRGFTGSGTLQGELAFCGYGLSQPEIGYDDYAGIDVKGKIVIVFKANPSWKMNDSAGWSSGYPREKAATAQKHGAIGMLIVSSPKDSIPQKTILSILEGKSKHLDDFPQMHIDIPVADEFLNGSGFTLKRLQVLIDSLKHPSSLVLKTEAGMEVHAKHDAEKQTMNVVGLLEGSDESLSKEYLVIGGHLDHVGSQGGVIYAPGANDNASGASAVLQMARAFTSSGAKPKRSIIFVTFASEEIGLAGSSHFVDHPPVPLDSITAMLNLDCIGFGDSIQVGNGKSAPQLWNIARHLDSASAKMMVERTWDKGGADAGPFHGKGIPALYFVSTNSYKHLHYITDTPETLNPPLFEAITKLAYITAYDIANGEYKRETVKP
jgi:hypothetical protein